MIPTKEKIEEISNLPGEEVLATIGDPRMVMKSLTKLYSNTALATIREYSTNARDSNVEAGRSDVPIEVSLPSILNPYFIVKDTGIGLSEDGLKAIYVSYGTSTKRNSNDFNGMLGFGSKSALAYTNTFTVTAVKDGIETIAVITRKPDYTVALKIVTTRKVSERNGVTIKVPVQEPESFRKIAMDFYRFWMPGTILVDGEEPVQAVGEKLSDNLYYSKTAGTSYVVMGNVGYRIANPDALFKKTNAVPFVAYVPNGSVEFTPSREDLEYSEATKNTLHSVIDKFEQEMYERGKAEIESKTDPFEAYSAWVEWSERVGNLFNEVEFNGETFTNKISYTNGWRYNPFTYRRYNTDELSRWTLFNVELINKNFLITDYRGKKLHSAHKTKIKEYLSLKELRPNAVYVISDEKCDNQWVKPDNVIKWDDLLAALPKKPKKPRAAQGSSGRIPGSFDYWDEKGTYHIGKELPEDVKVFWVSVAEEKERHIPSIMTYLLHKKANGFKNPCVVKLQANRIEKFKRDNPQTKNILEFAENYVVLDGISLLSEDAKLVLNIKDSSWSTLITSLNSDQLLDKEWKRIAGLLAAPNKLVLDYELAYNFASNMGKRYEFKRFTPVSNPPEVQRVNATYPILSRMLRNSYNFPDDLKEEWIAYMNDAYKRKVKTNV